MEHFPLSSHCVETILAQRLSVELASLDGTRHGVASHETAAKPRCTES